jgi:hypothetical protein
MRENHAIRRGDSLAQWAACGLAIRETARYQPTLREPSRVERFHHSQGDNSATPKSQKTYGRFF